MGTLNAYSGIPGPTVLTLVQAVSEIRAVIGELYERRPRARRESR
jgi:hypothetical protein